MNESKNTKLTKVTGSLEPDLLRALKHYSISHGMNMNQAIAWILKQYFTNSQYLKLDQVEVPSDSNEGSE